MEDISQRVEELKTTFNQINDWEDKYRKIIEMGKGLDPLDEAMRLDEYKVKGCQSQVWLFPEVKDDRIFFHADSDATIVKGIIAVLLSVYSGSTFDEVLTTRPSFVEDIGLKQHLSMSRANGLNSMLKQIGLYALAFKTKYAMGK